MPGDLRSSGAMQIADLARRLAGLHDEPEARQLLVTEAVAVFGCTAAGFGRRPAGSSSQNGSPPVPAGRLEFTFGGEPGVVAQLTGAMRAMPEAIALTALRQEDPVVIGDLTADHRWSEYAAAMLRRLPVRSLLAHRVQLSGTALGVLVLHSTEADFFDADSCELAGMLAGQAALALALLAGRVKNRNLTIALETGREIGQAMGILMATRKITGDRAFELLKSTSQQAHVKLRAVAREVILTGQLPA